MAFDAVFGELLPGSLGWSFAGAAWAFVVALLLGAALWPRLADREAPPACLVVWWLIGTALMGPIVLGLSAFHLMTSRGLVATCAGVTVLAGAVAGRRLVACASAAARGLATQAREGSAATRMGMAALGLVLGIALLLACIPTTHYDDLVYHLGLPRQALILGSWPAPAYFHHAFMPAGWEAAQALPLALGGGGGPQLMNASVLMLLAVATLRVARRAMPAAAPWAPWIATAIILSFPVFIGLAAIAGNDLIVALGLIVALERLLAMSDDGATDARHVTLVAGLAAGTAAAAKFTGLLGAAVLCAMAFLWTSGGLRPRLTRAVGVGLLTLVVASPWFLRAAALTGNPVYPQAHGVFGGAPWDERSARLQTRDGSQGSMATEGAGGVMHGVESLFEGADLLGIPAGTVPYLVPALWILAIVIIRRHRDLPRLLAYTGAAYLAWAATSYFLRFFLTPLLALAFVLTMGLAMAQGWLARAGVRRPDVVLALAGLLAVMGALGRAADMNLAWLGPDTTWGEAFSRREVLPRRVEAAQAEKDLGSILPRDARLFVMGETRLGLLPRAVEIGTALDPPLVVDLLGECRTPEELTERLRGRATHVLVNYRELARFVRQYEVVERLGPEGTALVKAWLRSLEPPDASWGAIALFDLAQRQPPR